MSNPETTDPVEKIYPVPSLMALGLQHVLVMYAGAVIESGLTQQVLHQPLHPYSVGLLDSAPDNGEPRSLLRSIPGTVPNLARLPGGCAFRERCFAAGEGCGITPALRPIEQTGQQAACWYPQREKTHV